MKWNVYVIIGFDKYVVYKLALTSCYRVAWAFLSCLRFSYYLCHRLVDYSNYIDPCSPNQGLHCMWDWISRDKQLFVALYLIPEWEKQGFTLSGHSWLKSFVNLKIFYNFLTKGLRSKRRFFLHRFEWWENLYLSLSFEYFYTCI